MVGQISIPINRKHHAAAANLSGRSFLAVVLPQHLSDSCCEVCYCRDQGTEDKYKRKDNLTKHGQNAEELTADSRTDLSRHNIRTGTYSHS